MSLIQSARTAHPAFKYAIVVLGLTAIVAVVLQLVSHRLRWCLASLSSSSSPGRWAQTQHNIARVLLSLKDWSQAVLSYLQVLRMDPDDREAHVMASSLYHEKLFQFSSAFTLDQQWLDRHPDDLFVLSTFAEKHFTTGRFIECAQRLVRLLAHSNVPPQVAMALQALEVAVLLALEHRDFAARKIDSIQEQLFQQPENFVVTWSFEGTLHSIHQHDRLRPYRDWLQQWFRVFTIPDRQHMITGLHAAQTSFPAGIK